MSEVELLTAEDISRTVSRLAHQIIEKTAVDSADADPVVLLGIPTRGVPLAQRLAERIEQFSGVSIPTGSVDITLFRDDLNLAGARTLGETVIPDGGIDATTVILVDDVLFSGRTIRAAMDALRDHGRPSRIQLAVLIDRGHRQLPIRADYVGKNVPTRQDEDVSVCFEEHDGQDSVTLASQNTPKVGT